MTTDINVFEAAARLKLRFTSIRGPLSVEMLWDIDLLSKDGFNLDAIAKEANRALKAISEESFVKTDRHPKQDELELALDIVKYIIEVKLEEARLAKVKAENAETKKQLLGILAEKKAGALSDLSEKELLKRIQALD